MNKILPNKILPNKTLKNPFRLRGYNSVSARNAGRNLTKGLSKILCGLLIISLIASSMYMIFDYDNNEKVSIQWSPPANTKVWNATADTGAGNHSAWIPIGAPSNGEDVIFNSTSVYNCSWNLTIADLGNFMIDSGYIGTVTQAATFGVNNFSIVGGIFTGNPSYTLTCAGDFTTTGGYITDWLTYLIMNGNNKLISTHYVPKMAGLEIQENINLINGYTIAGSVGNVLSIFMGKTLTIASNKILSKYWYSWSIETNYVNNGIITGDGSLLIQLYNEDKNITFGNVKNVIISTHSASTEDRILNLNVNTTVSGTLDIYSTHALYTIELNTNNYSLNINDNLTFGTRGILNGTSSTITLDNANWDSTLGNFNSEDSSVSFAGTGTIETAELQSFNNLTIVEDAVTTFNSEINVTNILTISGNLIQNDREAILNSSANVAFIQTENGDWNGIINLTGDSEYKVLVYEDTTGHIKFSNDCEFILQHYAVYDSLTIQPTNGNLTLYNISWDNDITSWGLNGSADIVVVIVKGLFANYYYNIFIDDILYLEDVSTNSLGELTFSYSETWSEHIFQLNRGNSSYIEIISPLGSILIYISFFILLLIMSFIGLKWHIPVINLISVLIGFFSLIAVLSLFEELIIIPLTIVIIMCFLLIKVLKY